MKVKGGVTQTQVVEGSISKAELLALVRETVHIPAGAAVRFYATGQCSYGLIVSSQQLGPAPTADVTDLSPLKFRITWEVPVAKNEQG